jgi:hypothetical protein
VRIAGWSLLLATALPAGCSSSTVAVDYDPKTDFSKVRSWAWGAPPASTPRNLRLSPFTLERARRAIEDVLTRKGLAMSSPEHADVTVTVQEALGRRIEPAPAYVGWGWGWGHPGWAYGWSGYSWDGPSYYQVEETMLLIEFLQGAAPGRLVWRGAVRRPLDEDLSPEDQEARIRAMVEEVLSRFPPTGR